MGKKSKRKETVKDHQPFVAKFDLECVADLLFWSEENGSELIGLDYLSGKLYVPKVDITDILKEVGMH